MKQCSSQILEKRRYTQNMTSAGRPSNAERSEYGKLLYDARKKAGLSQKEVADALGVTQQYVAAWERIGKTLRLELLVNLAVLYNMSLDELIGLKHNRETKGPTGRLRKSFDRASQLSRRQQEKIAEFVEAFAAVNENK